MPHPRTLLIPLLLLGACKDDPGPAATAGEPEDLTFWQDVAPILYDRCVGCHQAGGIAPFRLDTYADAQAWADASAAAVQARTMPPYLVTADGSCGEFHGSRALPDDEIAAIVAWAGAGAPEGEPRDDLAAPPPPHFDDGLDVATPEFTPQIAGGPLAEFDEYRCFLVDPDLDRDVFITGHDVLPGNPALVHHVLVMPVDPARVVDGGKTNAEVMQAMDDESPDRPGWPCFSQAGEGVAIENTPVTWAPGMGAVEFPADTGVRLAQSHKLVVQMHYNMHDQSLIGQSDATTVRLRLADEVARPAYVDNFDGFIATLFDPEPATLAPDQATVQYSWTAPLGEWLVAPSGLESMTLHGIFPHMHERGRRWTIELLDAADAATCAGEVRRWDFDWQLYYFYEQPLTIGPTTRVRVTCEYDTTGIEQPIAPGWGTQNEMCTAGLYLAP